MKRLNKLPVTRSLPLTAFLMCYLFCSCAAHHPVPLYTPEHQIPAKYTLHQALKDYTRSATLHHKWATTLDVDALYVAWPVRYLLTEEKIRKLHLSEEKADAIRTRAKDLDRGYLEFYIALFTTKQEWNNLDADEPVWRVFLMDQNGREIPSFRVEKADIDAAERVMVFPEKSQWKTLYKVSFLRQPANIPTPFVVNDSSALTLLFTGFLGKVGLTWEFSVPKGMTHAASIN